MDIVDPNTIITDEMLSPKRGTFILTIANYKKDFESIKYMGDSEILALRNFKEIPHNDKVIVEAIVTYSDLFKEKYKTEFIIDYKVTRIIKRGNDNGYKGCKIK